VNLQEYQKKTNASYSHIAKKCGVSPARISQIAMGGAKPGFSLAVAIETATDGQVGRENWYPPRPPDASATIGKIK
jgi:DNA-binding transcriptional regulator YdaS (Cro superfamily)